MGQHSSARTGAGRSRWQRAAIVGVGVGFAYATVGVVGSANSAPADTPSVYLGIAPVSVLGRALVGGSTTNVTIAGSAVPGNATSVQLSVTALSGTTTSSMYVYATGDSRPSSANVRWQAGETVTIPVTVGVGTGGDISVHTDTGTVTVKISVVGYFSPAAAPSGAAYAAHVAGPVTLPLIPGALATVTVPAGSYEIQAKIVAHDTAAFSDFVDCVLKDPANALFDSSSVSIASANTATLSLVGLDLTSGGTFTLGCESNEVVSTASDIDLVAVQLSSAAGDVTGS